MVSRPQPVGLGGNAGIHVVVVGDLVAQFVDLGCNPALIVVDIAVDAAFGIDAGGEVPRGVIFKAPFVALRGRCRR
jgi:hypothetical protein